MKHVNVFGCFKNFFRLLQIKYTFQTFVALNFYIYIYIYTKLVN